jgi:hypothetical protein
MVTANDVVSNIVCGRVPFVKMPLARNSWQIHIIERHERRAQNHSGAACEPNSSAAHCRPARNQQATKYHPDNGSEPDSAMMAAITRAFTEACAAV